MRLISKETEEEKTGKVKQTKVSFLNSIGDELGRLLIKESWKFNRLLRLWKDGGRDEKLIIINTLGKIGSYDYRGTREFISIILEDINNWKICDQLALKVIVNLTIQNRDEMFSLMNEWLESENKWIRRLAIATIPPYIRSRPEESEVCLRFLDRVMYEKDIDVKKAVGWALCEISKKDSRGVFKFLIKWARFNDNNTIWIIKDGMKKLSDEDQEKIRSLFGD